ncbi:MAG: hypothetical protein OXC07_02610 [Kistimonas sp.]|nr:hypothetical protein [Kistimonas sp.]
MPVFRRPLLRDRFDACDTLIARLCAGQPEEPPGIWIESAWMLVQTASAHSLLNSRQPVGTLSPSCRSIDRLDFMSPFPAPARPPDEATVREWNPPRTHIKGQTSNDPSHENQSHPGCNL